MLPTRPYTITVDAANKEKPVTKVEWQGEYAFSIYGADANGGESRWLIKNEEAVKITVQKKWLDADGNPLEDSEMPESIQVELWRSENSDHTGNKEYKETVTLSKENNWQVELTYPARRDGGNWYYYLKEKGEEEGIYEDAEKGLFAVVYEEAERTQAILGYDQILTVMNRQTTRTGSLEITKTVDKVNAAYGDAVFTFKITNKESGEVYYRDLTFGASDREQSKTVILTDIPIGEYEVEELSNLRYQLVTKNNIAVTVEEDKTAACRFRNEQKPDENYSHSDVVVNSFRRNDDGSVTISKRRETVE